NVTGKVLPTPAVGIPASFPLPFPLSMKVTPLGRAPVSVKDGAGKPVVSTANNPEVPNVKAVLLRLVKVGASFTVKAKLWLAGAPTRSEEHTSELQSLRHLVCRLLLEKKKKKSKITPITWSKKI